MEVGIRVVRGPDWQWRNQDDGEGHIGTLVEIGKSGSKTSPDKTVVIQWDSGSRTNYRVGYQGKYDLRIFDNATIGVRHPNVICDNCKKRGIQGVRWKCTKCFDFDLCTYCYMADKHDLTHQFMRFESSTSQGFMVPKRAGSVKITAKGIFKNAIVVRGPDWDWQDQDGGEGKSGKVVETRGWDKESGNSVACVQWTATGLSNVYRVGHKGKVDLKYVQESIGGAYYKDHLIVLGLSDESIVTLNTNVISPQNHLFSVGDKVKINVTLDVFKQMQEGHGGWNTKMSDLIGKIGTIHRVTDKGDIRVQYEGTDNRWTICPNALTKVCSFSVGDYVRINNDEEMVKNLQKGHGEWTDNMKAILNKICRITTVYGDGDLRVNFNGNSFTLNPLCCSSVPKHQADMHNTIAYHNMEDATMHMVNQFKDLLDDESIISVPGSPDQLVREAAHGHLQIVKDLLTKSPNIIDQGSSGKTALQVSCHQGHIDVVRLLLQFKANLEIKDNDGDTALHYSCFGNQSEITELLIQKNANINAVNNNGCSALHVAVNKQHVNCVKVLLKYKCDCNIQDSYGDTALHDIIGKEINKESKQIIELLLSMPSINLSLRNKRGFNTLHHASLKGNAYATEKLIAYSPQLTEMKKDDGFSAFHLAALNGHKEVVKCLLQSKADKEILNNRRQTPLLLAVAQLHAQIIELLVEKKANVNAVDEDGDTCLHLALNDKIVSPEMVGQIQNNNKTPTCELKDCKLLSMISQNMPAEFNTNMRLIIASFLIQNGANLYSKNKHQISPVDHVTDPKFKDFLQKQYLALQPPDEPTVTKSHKCKLCDEEPIGVTFLPCQHRVVCVECSIRLKRCTECNEPINEKVRTDGSTISINKTEFTQLINKIQALEEAQICSICMERKKDTALQCGHLLCNICAAPLKACHICREKVIKRFKIYEA